jgi:dienelactone hydrolase
MTDEASTLPGWERSRFSAAGFTRDVLRRGAGPGVVVIHEVPGITPRVERFANEVVDAGFTVVMPSLVGRPGKPVTTLYGAQSMASMCVAREFAAWAVGRTAPVIAWLRALAGNLHADVGGPGVGAVGMCFSGGFALGMMVDDRMIAPVLSQPSLPIALGRRRSSLHVSADDLATIVDRAANGCQVLGLRFDRDPLVGGRFDALREALGDAFVAVELPSSKRSDHSVLTEHRDDASVERVIDFLVEKLQPAKRV